jgi:hypothetical protein
MLLFGHEHLYASHLPLYRGPHAAQVILELAPVDPAVTDAYRREFGDELTTLEPESFDLGRLAPGAVEPLTEFRGVIYRGHFERGGQPWRQVALRVIRVLVFRTLDAAASDEPQPVYFAFGAGDETFLARKIGGRPDCDQILAVDGPAPVGTAIERADPSALPAAPGDPCPSTPTALIASQAWGRPRMVYQERADLQ